MAEKSWMVRYTATHYGVDTQVESALFVTADTCMEAFQKADEILKPMKEYKFYSDYKIWAVNNQKTMEEDSNA